MTSERVDRDFGAADERTWTVPELHDEIVRRAVDAIDDRDPSVAPLLEVLLDVARLRQSVPDSTNEPHTATPTKETRP